LITSIDRAFPPSICCSPLGSLERARCQHAARFRCVGERLLIDLRYGRGRRVAAPNGPADVCGSDAGFDAAVAAANNAQQVVLALGESREMSGEASSRSVIDLPEHRHCVNTSDGTPWRRSPWGRLPGPAWGVNLVCVSKPARQVRGSRQADLATGRRAGPETGSCKSGRRP
jgi:hypothetical protein